MNCKKCDCAMDINVRNKDGELMCPYCVEIDREEYQTKTCKICNHEMYLNEYGELVCKYRELVCKYCANYEGTKHYEGTMSEVYENKPYGSDCAAIEAAISQALRRRELELKNGGGKCKSH